MLRYLSGLVVFAVFTIVVSISVGAQSYGSGNYGSCQYGNCSLSLTTSGSVALDVLPTASGACTVASDSVSVSTAASTGYTLQLSSVDASTALQGAANGGQIVAASGSVSSPQILQVNRWGFRVDGGLFGDGPTSSSSNTAAPLSATFAGVASNINPATIRNVTQSIISPHITNVWYGVCANTSISADTYSKTVRYTALIN